MPNDEFRGLVVEKTYALFSYARPELLSTHIFRHAGSGADFRALKLEPLYAAEAKQRQREGGKAGGKEAGRGRPKASRKSSGKAKRHAKESTERAAKGVATDDGVLTLKDLGITRASQRAGELLAQGQKNGQLRPRGKSHVVSDDMTLTLKDLGITRDQSSQWQQLILFQWPAARARSPKRASPDLRHAAVLKKEKLPQLRARKVTFADLADAAITDITARYSRPADDVARLKVLKEHLVGRASAITPWQIQQTLDKLASKNKWSASTRNHHHNLISLAYRLGIFNTQVTQVTENPARAVQRKAENNSRVRFLTDAEETKLRAAIRSNPFWAPHEPELSLALATGLRRGSMNRDLVWENIDAEARTAKIPRTKNGDPIVIPLNEDAMAALRIFRARGDGTGRVVRNVAGKCLLYNSDWFVPAVRAAGIAAFRWHDTRHTFASRLRQAGLPLGNIAELLGHKGLAMTRRYAHLAISDLHEAVARIAKKPISIGTSLAPEPISERDGQRYIN